MTERNLDKIRQTKTTIVFSKLIAAVRADFRARHNLQAPCSPQIAELLLALHDPDLGLGLPADASDEDRLKKALEHWLREPYCPEPAHMNSEIESAATTNFAELPRFGEAVMEGLALHDRELMTKVLENAMEHLRRMNQAPFIKNDIQRELAKLVEAFPGIDAAERLRNAFAAIRVHSFFHSPPTVVEPGDGAITERQALLMLEDWKTRFPAVAEKLSSAASSGLETPDYALGFNVGGDGQLTGRLVVNKEMAQTVRVLVDVFRKALPAIADKYFLASVEVMLVTPDDPNPLDERGGQEPDVNNLDQAPAWTRFVASASGTGPEAFRKWAFEVTKQEAVEMIGQWRARFPALLDAWEEHTATAAPDVRTAVSPEAVDQVIAGMPPTSPVKPGVDPMQRAADEMTRPSVLFGAKLETRKTQDDEGTTRWRCRATFQHTDDNWGFVGNWAESPEEAMRAFDRAWKREIADV